MRINELREELRERSKSPTHRWVYDTYELLNNHRTLLMAQLDKDQLGDLLAQMKGLAETHPLNYGSDAFEREAQRTLQNILYLMERAF